MYEYILWYNVCVTRFLNIYFLRQPSLLRPKRKGETKLVHVLIWLIFERKFTNSTVHTVTLLCALTFLCQYFRLFGEVVESDSAVFGSPTPRSTRLPLLIAHLTSPVPSPCLLSPISHHLSSVYLLPSLFSCLLSLVSRLPAPITCHPSPITLLLSSISHC